MHTLIQNLNKNFESLKRNLERHCKIMSALESEIEDAINIYPDLDIPYNNVPESTNKTREIL